MHIKISNLFLINRNLVFLFQLEIQMGSKMFGIRKHLNNATSFIFPCLTTESLLLIFLLLLFFQNKDFQFKVWTWLKVPVWRSQSASRQAACSSTFPRDRHSAPHHSACPVDFRSFQSNPRPERSASNNSISIRKRWIWFTWLATVPPDKWAIFWWSESLKWSLFSISRKIKSVKQEQERMLQKESGKM